ncbi:MAG: GGDEF domain-containing protein [Actinomycetota bacterium]
MTSLPYGLVLPSDILTQTWFGVLGLFVALNTVVYLGLTVAKFVPWPAQVRPATVRKVLPITPEGPTMEKSHRSATRQLEQPVQDLRDAAARQTIPMALALVGALTAIVALLYLLLYFTPSGPLLLLGPVYGFILIVVSLLLARSRASATTMRWTWTLLMLALMAENCWRASVIDSAVPLAYSLVILAFIAPISLSWQFGIAGAIIGAIPVTLGGYGVSVVDTFSWGMVSITASLGSLVILYLRLVPLDRIAEEQARADALATTDARTGMLSRTGLIALAPSVAEAAEHAGESVSVIACTLPDLSMINAAYGFDYGGDALIAASRSFRAALPASALVSRWGGGTFLALLSGDAPTADHIRDAVDSNLAASGIALGKTPLHVRVGAATGSPAITTLEALVAEAETAAAEST